MTMESNKNMYVDANRSRSIDSNVPLLYNSTVSIRLCHSSAVLVDLRVLCHSTGSSAPCLHCSQTNLRQVSEISHKSLVAKLVSFAPLNLSEPFCISDAHFPGYSSVSSLTKFVPTEQNYQSDLIRLVLLNCIAGIANLIYRLGCFKSVALVLSSHLQYPYATFLMACFWRMHPGTVLAGGHQKSDLKHCCRPTVRNMSAMCSSDLGEEVLNRQSFVEQPSITSCLTTCQLSNCELGNPEEADNGYHSGEFDYNTYHREQAAASVHEMTDCSEKVEEGCSTAVLTAPFGSADPVISSQTIHCLTVADVEDLSGCDDLEVDCNSDSDDDSMWESDSDDEQTPHHTLGVKSSPTKSCGSSFFIRASTSDDSANSESSEEETGNCSTADSDSDWGTDDDDDVSNGHLRADLSCIGELDPFQVSGLYIPSFSTTPVVKSSNCCPDKHVHSVESVQIMTPESPQSPHLKSVNDKWNMAYDDQRKGDACQTVQPRQIKVKFASKQPSLIPIMHEEIWFDDYQTARSKYWENFALDRSRFRRRIDQIEQDIGWIFDDSHRTKVYQKIVSEDSVQRP